MTTRNQRLAKAAYDHVIHFRNINTVKGDEVEDDEHSLGLMECQEKETTDMCRQRGKSNQKKYGTMAHKLPVLVRTAGLVQAVAFVQTRGSEAQKELLSHLAETLGYEGVNTFAADARTHNLQDYMLLTRRVLAALLWYKRFAESILDVLSSDEDTEGNE